MQASPQGDLLDFDQLAVFAEIGLADFKEILDDMIADVPALLLKVKAALVEGNETAGRTAAHTLRGMLLNFGSAALASRLRMIEVGWLAAGENPVQTAADLDQCWLATRQALDAWVASLRG